MSGWMLLQSIKRPGIEQGQFDYARGFDLSSTSRSLTVADINNKRIQVVDESGCYIHHWPVNINGSHLCPLNLRRQDSEIVVAVVEGHAVLYKCPDVANFQDIGVKLQHIFGNEELVFPRSILINRQGHYVITDVGRHRVTVHDIHGKLLQAVGCLGTKEASEFNWPYYSCTDSRGRIAVSDSHNRCIKLFDGRDLKFIKSFGTDQLSCATGVCESLDGKSFYVGDYDTKSIVEYSCEGRYIGHVDKDMATPSADIQVDDRGRIFTTIQDGFCIYQMKEQA